MRQVRLNPPYLAAFIAALAAILTSTASAGTDRDLYSGFTRIDPESQPHITEFHARMALGIEAAHANGLLAIAHLDQVSWLTAPEPGIDGLLHALPTSVVDASRVCALAEQAR